MNFEGNKTFEDQGPEDPSRRDFLKQTVGVGAAAMTGAVAFSPEAASAETIEEVSEQVRKKIEAVEALSNDLNSFSGKLEAYEIDTSLVNEGIENLGAIIDAAEPKLTTDPWSVNRQLDHGLSVVRLRVTALFLDLGTAKKLSDADAAFIYDDGNKLVNQIEGLTMGGE